MVLRLVQYTYTPLLHYFTIFNTHVIQMNRGTTVPHHLLPASIDSPVAITITGAGAIVGATSSEALRNGRKTFEAEVQSVFCF